VISKTQIRPFILFEGNAEEAMTFYAGLFPGSEINNIVRYGPGEVGAEGSVMKATFTLAGQSILCTDSAFKHDFTFTPSISLFVDCESDQQIRQLAAALSEGGKEFMPLDNYGFSRKFAWVSDRFGVSWQLNLA
jgi:predicted 3-demethylubiquinone-9 3-methyltransferase (glyoxalase superfamily)